MADAEFIDPTLPLWLNTIVIIANILNLIYNVPQMIKTYRRKTTRDISGIFLLLRFVANTIFTIYTIYISNVQLSIANIVSVLSTLFIGYYKIKELIHLRSINKYTFSNDDDKNEIYHMSVDIFMNQLQGVKNEYGNIPIIFIHNDYNQLTIKVIKGYTDYDGHYVEDEKSNKFICLIYN